MNSVQKLSYYINGKNLGNEGSDLLFIFISVRISFAKFTWKYHWSVIFSETGFLWYFFLGNSQIWAKILHFCQYLLLLVVHLERKIYFVGKIFRFVTCILIIDFIFQYFFVFLFVFNISSFSWLYTENFILNHGMNSIQRLSY